MNLPAVSAIIAACGVEQYIAYCIDSIINQIYKIFRISLLLVVGLI